MEYGSLLGGENDFSDGLADLELEVGELEVREIHPVEWKTASYQKAGFPDPGQFFPHD
jgi:hypothetical protein